MKDPTSRTSVGVRPAAVAFAPTPAEQSVPPATLCQGHCDRIGWKGAVRDRRQNRRLLKRSAEPRCQVLTSQQKCWTASLTTYTTHKTRLHTIVICYRDETKRYTFTSRHKLQLDSVCLKLESASRDASLITTTRSTRRPNRTSTTRTHVRSGHDENSNDKSSHGKDSYDEGCCEGRSQSRRVSRRLIAPQWPLVLILDL